MVELTEREQKIIHYIMTMNNPQTKDQPLDIRILALKSVIMCAGLNFDYEEMKDLSEAIKAENERAMLSGMGMLDKINLNNQQEILFEYEELKNS